MARRFDWVQRLRLVTGLILFAYLLTHFANHALGLVSLAAMEAGRVWFLALWRSPIATLLLYGSLLTHTLLALWSLYRRRHLRMPWWEAWQLVLGLVIPPLLVAHVVGTRVAAEGLGTRDSYTRVVLALWEVNPERGLRQALVLVIAWLHGCIGLHFWLRLRAWYSRAVPWLYALAVLVPVCALLGFAQAGREVSALARQPGWIAATARAGHAPDPAGRAWLDHVEHSILGAFVTALAAVLAARGTRALVERRRGLVRIAYPGGREVTVPVGFTVLEASRRGGIPHASVCGGRGRCSTCRIRIDRGLETVAPAGLHERRVLGRVDAPPNVRLACQLRPTEDLAVTPLLPPEARAADALGAPAPGTGREQEITVLFADLRGFTQVAERKLPYDVVFILNRYFEAVGRAIDGAGGTVNQFTGDGVMALFGVATTPETACRQALQAAAELVDRVAELSRELAPELSAPLRIGIGVHTGPAVVGRMGYGSAIHLTAVGDTVHVASRLEELTKEYGVPLVVSEPVARRAGLDVSAYPRHDAPIRHRAEPLAIRVIADVAGLRRAASD
jgi:adenylate cyclase